MVLLFKNLIVIFVELLNEGTESFRPVIAEDIKNGRFRILELPEYSELEEEWVTPPGSIVKLSRRVTYSGYEIDVAVFFDGDKLS